MHQEYKNWQYYKFCLYGFLKNLRFFDAFILLFFIENGISFTYIGILYATREVVINLFEIISGIIADTYGRKSSLLISFLFYIGSFLIFYFNSAFVLLLFAMILYGMADAFRSGTHKGMIMDYLRIQGWENYKVFYYGHTRSYSMIGSAISALIGGALVLFTGSYRIIFAASIIPYLINLANIYSYPNRLNFSLYKLDKQQSRSLVNVFGDFWNSIKNPTILRIINATALHTAYLKAMKDYIQPVMVQVSLLIPLAYVDDLKSKSGIIIGIIYFLIFLLTSLASKNAYRFLGIGYNKLSIWTMLFGLSAGVLCGFFYVKQVWIVALLAFILIYIGENIRKPVLTGQLADNTPPGILTSVLSAQSFYSTIVTSVIAVSIGVIADGFGVGYALLSISIVIIVFFSLVRLVSGVKRSVKSR